MTDWHLNLFYSYSHALVEDNLTRAFIMALHLVSGHVRDGLLKSLLQNECSRLDCGDVLDTVDFTEAQFALQGYMEKGISQHVPLSYLMTIASHKYIPSGDDNIPSYTTSIPDAWIYHPDNGYCFLIEAKIGTNPLNDIQLYSHAQEWLCLVGEENIHRHILSLTWFDVLQAIHDIRVESAQHPFSLNQQEASILSDLQEYLGFFGYRLFHGFHFGDLQPPPAMQ